MDIPFRNQSQVSVVNEDEAVARPPYPALIIAFAICATLLWAGALLWLLSRMLLFLVA